jgi:transcriptional regulator with XRE-family HTH domain
LSAYPAGHERPVAAIPAAFIADLVRARRDADLNQVEAAALIGVSPARLSEFESGNVRLFPRLIEAWAAALGLRIVAVPVEESP